MRIENNFSKYVRIERGESECFRTGSIQPVRKTVQRELEVLPGFIIDNYNLNNVRYANDTNLLAYLEETLQEIEKVSK